MLSELRSDLDRLPGKGLSRMWLALRTPGMYPLALYRFGHDVYTRWPARRARVGKVVYRLAAPVVGWCAGVHLSPSAEIGPGLYIGHWGGIRVGPTVVMGKRCNLSPQVILGYGEQDGVRGEPHLGDEVYVGAGAKVLGPVRVGARVAIGANAVVCRDVPSGVSVGGVPARVISRKGSARYLQPGQPLAATPGTRPIRNELVNGARGAHRPAKGGAPREPRLR